jgi:hypothetical protein
MFCWQRPKNGQRRDLVEIPLAERGLLPLLLLMMTEMSEA